jgi:hypothetical protein
VNGRTAPGKYREQYISGVQKEPGSSWLKDPRVRASIAGAAVAGFLLGLLVFGQPWHRSPDFGDVPTWLAATFAAFAGWIALDQLRILREQVAEEADRNEKRDELLDRQLAEAEARAVSYRRSQAEEVKVRLQHRGGGDVILHVVNDSKRPITDIASRLVTMTDAGPVPTVEPEWGDTSILALRLRDQFPVDPEQRERRTRIRTLKPGQSGAFSYPGLLREETEILVVWFTDDAKFRWQLDELQHLTDAKGNEYKP